jgi:glutathione S-transferase
MMDACDKGLHAAYERNRRPPENLHEPWIDDCVAQMTNALAAVNAMVDPGKP